jgi:gluconolactonase
MLDDGSMGPLSTIYPDPAVQILDQRFTKYRKFNSGVEKLASGTRWGEGPD